LPAATVRSKLPSMYDQFMELAGVDITRGPMEVGPTCHYFMGGIRVDAETGASTVPGLFATGECSGGMNGANRLGGNSLSDLLVFGRRAGIGASQFAADAPEPRLADDQIAGGVAAIEHYLSGPGDQDPYQLHTELQARMQDDVGIYRDEAGLNAAVAALHGFQRRVERLRSPTSGAAFNPGWHLCHDLRNMLVVSQAVAHAALLRHESRGAHSRLEFPDYDDYWSEHNNLVLMGPDGMVVEQRPVVKVAELEPLVEERKAQERGADTKETKLVEQQAVKESG
ncbi:MAG: FAD-binding protein, partial [Gaiellaceae bacterium]